MAYPTNYRYTREHEWLQLDGTIGTVGITDYAQNSLGDIVYVDVPKVGDTVTAHAVFGSVESVKAVSSRPRPTKSMKPLTKPGSSKWSCPIHRSSKGCWMLPPTKHSLRKRREAEAVVCDQVSVSLIVHSRRWLN